MRGVAGAKLRVCNRPIKNTVFSDANSGRKITNPNKLPFTLTSCKNMLLKTMDTAQQAALVSRTSDEVTQVYKTNYVLTSCNKSNPICFMQVRLIIMHPHIKSGHKGSSGKL